MENKREESNDRFQFIGLVGPLIILLTLLCTLFKGTPKSTYLYVVTIGAFPALWLWRSKGLIISMVSLFTLFFCFYPFFSSPEKIWQLGATASLGLGLFVSYMGIEEVKLYLKNLKIESQSRLDNLLELDEKFKLKQETWKIERQEFQTQLETLQKKYHQSQAQSQKLEKMTQALRQEHENHHREYAKLSQELESKILKISELHNSVIETQHKHEKIQSELEQDRSERELKAIEKEKEALEKLEDVQLQCSSLNQQLNDLINEKTNVEKHTEESHLALKGMQEALQDKVELITEMEEKLLQKNQELKKSHEDLQHLHEKLKNKEHDALTIKSALTEKDAQIQALAQEKRDLSFDLEKIQSECEGAKKELALSHESHQQDLKRRQENLEQLELELKALYEKLNLMDSKLSKGASTLEETLQQKVTLEAKLKEQKNQFDEVLAKQEKLEASRFNELKKLNDTRFALFQASLDKERLKSKSVHSATKESPKHWLMQLELLLKGEGSQKINFEHLPKELKNELLTLNQTKALYKQLRAQFDEKNEILEETRKELFHLQTQCEEFSKTVDEQADKQREPEKALHESLEQKLQEVQCMEKELQLLNELVGSLFEKDGKKTTH